MRLSSTSKQPEANLLSIRFSIIDRKYSSSGLSDHMRAESKELSLSLSSALPSALPLSSALPLAIAIISSPVSPLILDIDYFYFSVLTVCIETFRSNSFARDGTILEATGNFNRIWLG